MFYYKIFLTAMLDRMEDKVYRYGLMAELTGSTRTIIQAYISTGKLMSPRFINPETEMQLNK